MNALIVGARENSLGACVAECLKKIGVEATTAGISGEEDMKLDILDDASIATVLAWVKPIHVVCTVGINKPSVLTEPEFSDEFAEHMAINAFGPLNLLRYSLDYLETGSHFVAISSNSAHIARSMSLPYCTSKAALSMGIRCAAREIARLDSDRHPTIYGWEFGLLAGTPMTAQSVATFGTENLTRMVGLPTGIPVRSAAEAVASTLTMSGEGLNGVMLRMDAGEQ